MPDEARERTDVLIVGASEDPSYAQQVSQAIARSGLAGRVRLFGRADPSRIPDLLKSFDALVSLSGGSIMYEAMAAGVAVVSVRRSADQAEHIRDLDTAFRIEDIDPVSTGARLAAILADRAELRRVGARGHAYAAQRLSTATMAEKTRTVFLDVMARRAS
jgi:glycosyltransferase involved in cell wall biosynthesis